MITTRHEVFLAVAAYLNFSKAALVLYISQPAVSKHVKALEQHYKIALFNRKGTALQLTEAGHLLYRRLQEAKKIQNALEFELSSLTGKFKAKGHLKMGASTTVALYILPKVLSGFHRQFPEINISLLNRNSELILKALEEETIDVGIIEAKQKRPSILYQPFLKDDVVAVCSAKSPINRKLTLQELVQVPVVLREQGSGTLAALKLFLAKHSFKLSDLQVKVRLGGTEALKNFLIEDDCLGFLSRRSIHKELRDGELVEVEVEGLRINREFFFIQRQNSESLGLTAAFIRFAKSKYAQML